MSESQQKSGNKLVLLGDSGVGKTCLISRFVYDQFDVEEKTTGASYANKMIEYPDLKKNLVLDIWDTAGQEKYRSLTKFFYKDALMIIFVYDITRRESYENLKNIWYKEAKENMDPNAILGIAGNKCDLYDNEAVPETEAREFAKSINALFTLTSAQNKQGVEDLFKNIGYKFLNPNFQQKVDNKPNNPTISLDKNDHIDNPQNPEKKKKKRFC